MKTLQYLIFNLLISMIIVCNIHMYAESLVASAPAQLIAPVQNQKTSTLQAEDVQNAGITIAGNKNIVDARLLSAGDTASTIREVQGASGVATAATSTSATLDALLKKYRTQSTTYSSSLKNIGNTSIAIIGNENEASARVLSQGDDIKEKVIIK